jgi:hypothetical protein
VSRDSTGRSAACCWDVPDVMRTTPVRTWRHDVSVRPFFVIWEMTQACPRPPGAVSWSAFLLVPTGRGALLPALTAQQAEDVLNFVYDAGEFIPARTTEAHHFRRVVLQREILRRRGADHVLVLGLGELYLSLRERLGDLGLTRRTARR